VTRAPARAGRRHPALSDAVSLTWRGQSLFPRAVRPLIFTLLWAALGGLSVGLAVIGVIYLHDIGA
jgi:hypothetical protein